MMNDTTNNTPLPITMEEDTNTPPTQPEAPPLPLQDYALMASLIRTFTKHIETLVDQRFAALVESHKTLALMDENMQTAITEMIDDRIYDIESEVSSHVDHYLRQSEHQFITERELNEKVSDVLDEILEDRINASLSNASIEISI